MRSPDAFINYLRKQSKLQKVSRRQVISDWVDYLDMAKKQILPVGMDYSGKLAKIINEKEQAKLNAALERKLAEKVSDLNVSLYEAIEKLNSDVIAACEKNGACECARYYRDVVFPSMQSMRALADELEMAVPKALWPFPTYGDLMFRV